jgi:membrane protein DedA with SNARE-associated domain
VLSTILALADFLKPEKILDEGGLALLTLIVFAESGLLIGFFLPGDSLLFVAGFLSSDAGDHRLPALPFYRTFVKFNVIGGLLWGAGVTTLGYFLGEIDCIKDNIELAIILIVAISLLPVAIELWRHRTSGSSRTRA